MSVRSQPNVAMKVALVTAVAAALLAAWMGYGRGDIVRWFGAFLMCG